uniref:Uncharacterized protein n=1 Tax=Oryza barthii TaxID=65489 RepID=A0A0D3FV76_9ORYZ
MVKPHRFPLKAASSIVTDQINGATVVTIREVRRGCRERSVVASATNSTRGFVGVGHSKNGDDALMRRRRLVICGVEGKPGEREGVTTYAVAK